MDYLDPREFEFLDSHFSIREEFLNNTLDDFSEYDEGTAALQMWNQQFPEFPSTQSWNRQRSPNAAQFNSVDEWNPQGLPQTKELKLGGVWHQQKQPEAEEFNAIEVWNQQSLCDEFGSTEVQGLPMPSSAEELNLLNLMEVRGPQDLPQAEDFISMEVQGLDVEEFNSMEVWKEQGLPRGEEVWNQQGLSQADELNSIEVLDLPDFDSMDLWQDLSQAQEFNSMEDRSKQVEFNSLEVWHQPDQAQAEELNSIEVQERPQVPADTDALFSMEVRGMLISSKDEEFNLMEVWNQLAQPQTEELNSMEFQLPCKIDECNSLEVMGLQVPSDLEDLNSLDLWQQQDVRQAEELNSIEVQGLQSKELNSMEVQGLQVPSHAEELNSMEVWNGHDLPHSEESHQQVQLKALDGPEYPPEQHDLAAPLLLEEQASVLVESEFASENMFPDDGISKSEESCDDFFSDSADDCFDAESMSKSPNNKMIEPENSRLITAGPPHKCNVCSKICKSRRTFLAHHRTHLLSHQCFFCYKVFQSTSHLKLHLNGHLDFRPFSCPTCDKGFRSRGDLKKHEKRHLKITKQVNCLLCGNIFKFPDEFNCHISEHVAGQGPTEDMQHSNGPTSKSDAEFPGGHEVEIVKSTNKCNFCAATYKSRRSLIVHLHVHTTLYKCDQCNKTFQCPTHLKDHMQRHLGIRPHKCTRCDRTFRSQSDLKKHLQRHLDVANVSGSAGDKTFMEAGETKQHNCTTCGSTFSLVGDLNRHKKLHCLDSHPTNREPIPEGTTDGSANALSEKEAKDTPTIKSMVAAGPSFKCDLCAKAFYTSYALNMHCITHPTRPK